MPRVIGFRGAARVTQSVRTQRGTQPRREEGVDVLECENSDGNAGGSGKMHGYHEKLGLRRRRAGALVTRRKNGVGIEKR